MTRPLLSRRQLSLLILFLPGLILLLSRLGTEPEPANWQSDSRHRIYQQQRPAQDGYRVHLLLPLPLPDSPAIRLTHRLLFTALQQRLADLEIQPYWSSRLDRTAQLHHLPGYLLLELGLRQVPAGTDLELLLTQLQQPPELNWTTRLRRIQAEDYLARQHAEPWLRAHLPDQRDDTLVIDPIALYRNQLQPEHWQVTLSGPQPAVLELPERGSAKSIQPVPALSVRALPAPAPRQPASDRPLYLHRWPLPEIRSVEQLAHSLLTREAIRQRLSHRLEQPASQSGISAGFSLSWEPARPQGRATLILKGSWPALHPWLVEQLGQADLASARRSLLELLSRPEQQQQWVDLIALHQLPADTLIRLPGCLEELTAAELQLWLQQRLESDYYHSLSLPASP